jgi:hypothetical protein
MTANQSAATAETLGTTAADWWNTPETMHTPISQLVAGLDDLPELPIPYGRLPRRAYNVYSNDFTHWSDIAGQTPHALLSRRWAGESTVRALLAAAQDTVAGYRAAAAAHVAATTAVRRLLEQLDELDLAMLSARMWAPRQQSQRTVAEQLGVHPIWVQRNQPWAEARFAELVADPVHHEVSHYAVELRARLGVSSQTECHRLNFNAISMPYI